MRQLRRKNMREVRENKQKNQLKPILFEIYYGET